MYFVYILLCSDNSFYTGYSSNLQERLFEHNNKIGSFYLKSKLPIMLVYKEKHNSKYDAMKRERQIKGWSRHKKINLIKYGHPTKLLEIPKPRNHNY